MDNSDQGGQTGSSPRTAKGAGDALSWPGGETGVGSHDAQRRNSRIEGHPGGCGRYRSRAGRRCAARINAVLLGLDGFVVLAAEVVGSGLELLVETVEDVTGCPRCGQVATAHAVESTLSVTCRSAAGRGDLVGPSGCGAARSRAVCSGPGRKPTRRSGAASR